MVWYRREALLHLAQSAQVRTRGFNITRIEGPARVTSALIYLKNVIDLINDRSDSLATSLQELDLRRVAAHSMQMSR